jgi:hypothetical protein
MKEQLVNLDQESFDSGLLDGYKNALSDVKAFLLGDEIESSLFESSIKSVLSKLLKKAEGK